MNYHHSRRHRCNRCQQHSCCCISADTGRNLCRELGPFIAIDSDCIVPPLSTGSIIPFASGITPAVLASAIGGLAGTVSLIGFGTAIPGVSLVGNTINLPALNEAFSVPRAGSMSAISAAFTVTVALDIVGETGTVNAQIYRAPAGSNIFSPTGVSVDLAPPLTSLITVGTTLTGSSSNFAPVPVAVGDRLLMVFSLSGTTVVATVTGAASAGITID